MENNILQSYIIIINIIVLLAMNMGASGISPSFSAPYGAKLISHKKACLLFTLFVLLGAILFGKNVASTLGKSFIPSEYISFKVVLFIFLASLSGLILATILKIPQSTSWTTVFSIVGVGFALGHLETKIFPRLIFFWIVLPILSYFISYFLFKTYKNYSLKFNLDEKVLHHQGKIKKIGIVVSCYVAFAIGANNIANIIGPLIGAHLVNPLLGMLIISPIFGIGALLMGKRILTSVSEGIINVKIVSSTLINIVTATLLIFASILGLPQSLVQLSTFGFFGISAYKKGFSFTLKNKTTRKIFFTWIITPILSLIIGFSLTKIFLKENYMIKYLNIYAEAPQITQEKKGDGSIFLYKK